MRISAAVGGAIALSVLAVQSPGAFVQQAPRFGGDYSALDARRQRLVNNWVGRFVKTTGQHVEPGALYDDVLSLSAKTTFEAVTHALMTSALTDQSGATLGDALALVDQVDAVRGELPGASGDRQFRMYVRLRSDAVAILDRSQQFKRGTDNTVYHKGYPLNYREAGGVPSIQFSVALNKSRADIDVDYRSSSFPAALFNGHLTASNSDVRAGTNYDKHINRWSGGFQNWWRGFFGVRLDQSADASSPASSPLTLPKVPRVGKAAIDVTANDFLTAWLVEGNIVAAMGYVSDRAYSCLARDSDDPSAFDYGVAPFQLMGNLKSAYDSLGPHNSLDGLLVGTRLVAPALRVVKQAHHAQFVVYEVPDDVAAAFECDSESTLGDPKTIRRKYGTYFGTTFNVGGRRDTPVALLWARENDYWKIVSWRVGLDDAITGEEGDDVADPKVVRRPADPTLVAAARSFLENWLVRHDYDAAFKYISPTAYGCYPLERGQVGTQAMSNEDAGKALRESLESAGKNAGNVRTLEAIVSAAEPRHPAIRVLSHRYAGVFSLGSIPIALADAAACAARSTGVTMPDPMPLEYGDAVGMTLRFKTRSGDPPVLRLLWRRESGEWRITSYDVEMP